MNKLTITAAAPCDEINMELAKAIAICTVTRLARDILDKDSRRGGPKNLDSRISGISALM